MGADLSRDLIISAGREVASEMSKRGIFKQFIASWLKPSAECSKPDDYDQMKETLRCIYNKTASPLAEEAMFVFMVMLIFLGTLLYIGYKEVSVVIKKTTNTSTASNRITNMQMLSSDPIEHKPLRVKSTEVDIEDGRFPEL